MYNLLSIDLDWLKTGNQLRSLNKLFFDKVKNTKKIIFGNHHHIILNDLKNVKDINLYNIDDHHDILSESWQVVDIQNNISTHGCWVGNLLQHNRIKKYHWIKNYNSVPSRAGFYDEELLVKNNVNYIVTETLDELQSIEFDHIFICKSIEYTFKEYAGLYDTYLNFCQSFYKDITFERTLYTDMPNARIKFGD